MSIPYPAPLLAVGGARTGIAPVNLLDIQDVNGNIYLWSDRKILAPPAILAEAAQAAVAGATPPVALAAGQQLTWAFPTRVATTPVAFDGTVGATLSQGQIVLTGGIAEGFIEWSNFAMPALPPGSTLNAAYLVIVLKGSSDGSVTHVVCASNAGSLPANGNFSGQYSSAIGGSITEAAITGAEITASITDSTAADVTYQDLSISFAGIALYYTPSASAPVALAQYQPWLLSAPQFTFHRSLVTDTGSFLIQNLSGDSLSRDFEKLWRLSALEGAMFVYRLWQADAMASWLEVHGTLSVAPTGVDTAQLKGTELLNPSQEDTPAEIYCESCQLTWAGRRCGAMGSTECMYSFATCQVVERPMMVLNNYEKNYGEASAATAMNVVNRRRAI